MEALKFTKVRPGDILVFNYTLAPDNNALASINESILSEGITGTWIEPYKKFKVESITKSSSITLKVNVLDLSNLVVGSTFKLGKYQVESETPWDIEWEIVHQTDDYQIAQTKQIIDLRCFDAKEPTNTNDDRKSLGNNNWSVSNIKQFLNSDQASWYSAQHQYDMPPNSANTDLSAYDNHKGFLYYFSDEEKNLLQDTTFDLANPDVDGGGSYTWTGKVWLPTYTQMYGNQNNNISEGIKFDKYSNDNSRIKTLHPNCKLYNQSAKLRNDITSNGAWIYWMSSADPSRSYRSYLVDLDGSLNTYGNAYAGSIGLAPCICLPRSNGGGVINNTITFYIDNIEYKSPSNYTFAQWINTSYNYNGWYNNGSNIINYNDNTHINNITSSTIIEDGKNYKSANGSSPKLDFSTLSLGTTFIFGKYQVENETPWPIEWEIVHEDSDGLIAQTKQIIDLRAFDAKEPTNTDTTRSKYGNNNWQYSNIKQFLNSDQVSWYSAQHSYDAPPNSNNVNTNPYDTHKGFLYYFSDEEKNLLKDYSFTLVTPSNDGGGSYTWTGKVWLPTYTQLGYGDNKYYGSSTYISEGTKFDKYSDNTSRIKTINKYCAENNKYCIDKGYSEGSNWKIYLSSQDMDTRFGVAQTAISGGENSEAPGYGYGGITPCIYLPKTGGLWS